MCSQPPGGGGGGGGGGIWELQDLSSFVLGENYLCILYENIQEAFF